MHCIVAELDADSELVDASLCRKDSIDGNEQCINAINNQPIFGRVVFRADGSRSTGYTFTSQLPFDDSLLDSFYFCKLKNTNGIIASNLIEIQDPEYYQIELLNRKQQSGEKQNYLNELTPSSLPLTLPCGSQPFMRLPAWADQSFPSPFRWSFCDFSKGDGPYVCSNRFFASPKVVESLFNHILYPNGTIVLLSRSKASWEKVALGCGTHLGASKLFVTYYNGTKGTQLGPLVFRDDAPYTVRGIQQLSPPVQRLTFRAGSTFPYTLTAFYRSNPEETRTTWSKQGGYLHDFLKDDFQLQFPKPLYRNHSGQYKFDIQRGRDRATFTFDVNVIGPPEVYEPPPPMQLLMEGESAKVVCRMDNIDTSALEINGLSFVPGHTDLGQHYPYLKDINVTFVNDSPSGQLRYEASNLKYTPGIAIGPSHTVSLVGKNDHGIARASTLIKVLPQPKLLVRPIDSQCVDDCFSDTKHIFKCQFDLEPFSSIAFNQTWLINGIDIKMMREDDIFPQYVKQYDGMQLELLPIGDQDHVHLFENASITCKAWIPGLTPHDRIVYDSDDDVNLAPDLTAPVRLTYRHKPAKAGFMWIAATIIAAAILVIIIALIICIVVRGRGETYMVDREERALGNDPEKELRDLETFRTYERVEEPPLRGSRCSLNDDSAEIGSDADGELDGYDLDPGKFNEEGSFIDQYISDPHYKGDSKHSDAARS